MLNTYLPELAVKVIKRIYEQLLPCFTLCAVHSFLHKTHTSLHAQNTTESYIYTTQHGGIQFTTSIQLTYLTTIKADDYKYGVHITCTVSYNMFDTEMLKLLRVGGEKYIFQNHVKFFRKVFVYY